MRVGLASSRIETCSMKTGTNVVGLKRSSTVVEPYSRGHDKGGKSMGREVPRLQRNLI